MDWTALFAARMARVASSPIMDSLRAVASGKYVNFASGLPDPELFPREGLRHAFDEVLSGRSLADGALQYGSEEGHAPLRDWIASELSRTGPRLSAENVLVTAGSQQALDIAARLLLDPGDVVAVEDPTYVAFLQIADTLEARTLGIPMDAAGMRVDVLEKTVSGTSFNPKLVFTLPDFQNPTGLSMSVERRERLVGLCRTRGIPILEDGAYAPLRYEGERRPTLLDLSGGEGVLSTGTFSKTIAPGIRVGWIAGPREAIRRMSHLKQATDIQTSTLAQTVAIRYVLSGAHEPHVALIRRTIDERRRRMLAALEAALPKGASATRPAGGMFAWVTLPEGADSGRALRAAIERGVAFVPGRGFHPGPERSERTLRLNFASTPVDAIDRGVALLGEALAAS